MEPTAAALRQALALAHSAAADGPYGPLQQVHPAAMLAAQMARGCRSMLGGRRGPGGLRAAGASRFIAA